MLHIYNDTHLWCKIYKNCNTKKKLRNYKMPYRKLKNLLMYEQQSKIAHQLSPTIRTNSSRILKNGRKCCKILKLHIKCSKMWKTGKYSKIYSKTQKHSDYTENAYEWASDTEIHSFLRSWCCFTIVDWENCFKWCGGEFVGFLAIKAVS